MDEALPSQAELDRLEQKLADHLKSHRKNSDMNSEKKSKSNMATAVDSGECMHLSITKIVL